MVRCPRGRLLQVCLLWEGLQTPAGTSDEIVESQDRVIHPSEHFYALMDCTDDADADRRLMREVLRHTGLVASEYPEAEMRDLSRRIYQNWSGVAAEQLSLAEVHLLIYPRGFWHEEPVQMHLLQDTPLESLITQDSTLEQRTVEPHRFTQLCTLQNSKPSGNPEKKPEPLTPAYKTLGPKKTTKP